MVVSSIIYTFAGKIGESDFSFSKWAGLANLCFGEKFIRLDSYRKWPKDRQPERKGNIVLLLGKDLGKNSGEKSLKSGERFSGKEKSALKKSLGKAIFPETRKLHDSFETPQKMPFQGV